MADCIFCKIAKGEISSHKFYDDGEFIAILDINPNTEGQSLVIPREHHGPDISEMPDDVLGRFIVAAKKVAKQLRTKLPVKRCALVVEGTGVPHAHLKIFPMHGPEPEKVECDQPRVWFDRYVGYTTTFLGPRADDAKLAALAKRLR